MSLWSLLAGGRAYPCVCRRCTKHLNPLTEGRAGHTGEPCNLALEEALFEEFSVAERSFSLLDRVKMFVKPTP